MPRRKGKRPISLPTIVLDGMEQWKPNRFSSSFIHQRVGEPAPLLYHLGSNGGEWTSPHP